MSIEDDAQHCNEVRLVGRVAADPEVRTLPSGDELVTGRLVVRRTEPRPRAPSVDTLDCVAWSAAARRAMRRWKAGQLMEVRGALRRRFHRAGGAVASRYQVELLTSRRFGSARYVSFERDESG